MTKFEQELKNNNLVCSQCARCNMVVWPPSEFCNRCFDNVTWIPLSRKAKLIEFSRKDDQYFCIAELESGIRLMGTVESATDLKIGQHLILAKCDYDMEEKFMFLATDN